MKYTPEEEAFYAKRTMIIYDKIYDKNHVDELAKIKKKTNVQSTSKLAYKQEKPKLNVKQNELYTMLLMAKRPMCDAELSKYLGWNINSVTGRRNELVDMERVTEAFKGTYPATGKKVIYWKVKDGTEH